MTLPAQSTVHRSLDGRRFRFGTGFDLGQPTTSVLDVVIGGRLQEFTAGPVALGLEVAKALSATGTAKGFDQELTYQGGRLSIARTGRYDGQSRLVEEPLVAVWHGSRYCMVTHWYGGGTAELLGVLRTLRIEEHDDGLMVHPDRAAGTDLAAPATLIKQIPGLGLVELSPLTDVHLTTLPGWRGLTTPAGEMFKDTLSNGAPYFILAGSDIWATVVPLAGTSPDRVADRLGQLKVELVA
jgi:hypothetical protein